MAILKFISSPPVFKTASDVVGPVTVKEFQANGIQCEYHDIWPDGLGRLLVQSKIPLGRQLYKRMVAPLAATWHRCQIQSDDIIWGNDITSFANPADLRFERHVKKLGAKYIFCLHDNWLAVPGYAPSTLLRIEMADLVISVTPNLARTIQQTCPKARVLRLEVPINVERVKPVPDVYCGDRPLVIWTGNPGNLKELPDAERFLAAVYQAVPFTFRIVSGAHKPVLSLPIPWEWQPYSDAHESEALSGACAGLAPLQETPYSRCKDMYKIKTYLAAGVPVITSPVGHNCDVMRHGENGFLATTTQEWIDALKFLLSNPAKAALMGANARRDAVSRFSHKVLIPDWIKMLTEVFPQLRTEKQKDICS